MNDSASPAAGLLGFLMLLQFVALGAFLLGGLYLLYCLGRAAAGLDRLASAVEELVRRQYPPGANLPGPVSGIMPPGPGPRPQPFVPGQVPAPPVATVQPSTPVAQPAPTVAYPTAVAPSATVTPVATLPVTPPATAGDSGGLLTDS